MESNYIKFVPDDNQYGKPRTDTKKGRPAGNVKPKAKKKAPVKVPALFRFVAVVVALLVSATSEKPKSNGRKKAVLPNRPRKQK
jgi:hypothetical protein